MKEFKIEYTQISNKKSAVFYADKWQQALAELRKDKRVREIINVKEVKNG